MLTGTLIAANMHILTLPGYTNAGPQHWLTLWESRDARVQRVQQMSWDRPVLADWVAALDRQVAAAGSTVVLAGHSLGAVTVAHWAAASVHTHVVAGALLVAPADVEQPDTPAVLRGFAPLPLEPLPFRTTLVTGSDDPWVSTRRARDFATAWGSDIVVLEGAGHLDSNSGLGAWDAGWDLLWRLVPTIHGAASGPGVGTSLNGRRS
jgi:uncharacterized protein